MLPQQSLCFLPEPQEHGLLHPIFGLVPQAAFSPTDTTPAVGDVGADTSRVRILSIAALWQLSARTPNSSSTVLRMPQPYLWAFTARANPYMSLETALGQFTDHEVGCTILEYSL